MRGGRVALAALTLSTASGLWFAATKVAALPTHYSAKIACSAVFVSGRDLDAIRATDLQAMSYVRVQVDRSAQIVRAHILGLAGATAVYRPGQGCTLVHAQTPAMLRAQSLHPVDQRNPVRLRLVDAHDPVLTSSLGVDRRKLEAALVEAFDEPSEERPRRTRAVVVLYRGFLVAEGYREGLSPRTPLSGWSMTKGVLATLYGRALREGLLEDLDQPAEVAGWARDERRSITLRHLLQMSSGLRFEEAYGLLSDATDMLFLTEDAAQLAVKSPLEHPPGTHFAYSSGTTNILSRLLRQSLGETRYHAFPYEALFDPLGLRYAVMELDAAGTFVASSFMYATAREWARLGQLHLQDGVWEGRRLLPEGWVEFVTQPAPAAQDRQYGAHWWLNVGPLDRPEDRPLPSAPPDAYFMDGFEEQAVVVVPSRQAVIVRLGQTPPNGDWQLDAFVGRVLGGLPEAVSGDVRGQSARRTGLEVSPRKRASKPRAVAVNPAVSPHQ